MNADAILPAVGRVWLADFGTDGPWGRFAGQLDLISPPRLVLSVTHGKYKSDVGTVDYTTVGVGPRKHPSGTGPDGHMPSAFVENAPMHHVAS